MGDIKGFKKYTRSTPPAIAPEERVQHFDEFVQPVAEAHTTEQAARCMDCGIPFCHSGCPLGNIIPDFNDAVYKQEWRKAYDILASTNNFPEFTGRICPAPCEGSCVLGINNDPVAIEYIEKTIIEKAYENDWVQPHSQTAKTGKSIAVIGSGPAGLAAADQLSKEGHSVTVYERKDRVGGLLRYGIPDFKLGKYTIDRRMEIMEQSGVTFRTNTNAGVDITAKELQTQYDAIVLCGGATVARDLLLEGRQYKGVHLAMDYLEQSNRRVAGDSIPTSEAILVEDQDVVVLGGGDTGSDCIGTSNRLGARSITQIELLSKPPEQRTDHNPWPLWPQVLRTSSSHLEGCDREWSVLTKRFVSEDGTHLSGIETVRIDWQKDENGKYQMTELPGTEQITPCQKAFLAIGFVHGEQEGLLSQLGVSFDARGNVETNNYKTSLSNVFAAGDMRRGQSLVVWAINEGRECARAVDQYLMKAESQLASADLGAYRL